jgi:hypothetical protein
MRKILEHCPTCHADLTITELHCDACGTQVRSRYTPCPFCALTEEQQTFLLLFLRGRGNLKDLEKTLGISYPTVRAKLDELIDALPEAIPTSAGAPLTRRRTILDQLQSGALTADQALDLLRNLPE